MKKLIIILSSMLLGLRVFAGNAVQVNTNGVIVYPTNFFVANGIASTNTTGTNSASIAVLQSQVAAVSNAVVTSTGVTATVAARVTVLETNTATIAQGIAGTNAQARVGVLESTWIPYTNGNITATGTVTALHFVGDGSGMTGVVSAVTGGVNQITTSDGSNFTGNVVISGQGIGYGGPGTITVTRVDYFCRNIVLATNVYELTMEAPRDEALTITRIFGKVDAYQGTFSLLMQPSNSLWRAGQTILIPGIVALSTGTLVSTNIVIPAGYEWGIRVDDYDPRTTQMRVSYKTEFH